MASASNEAGPHSVLHFGSKSWESADVSREEVEPYLAALLQAEHLNVLFGAGLGLGLMSAGQREQRTPFPSELVWDEVVPTGVRQAIESKAKESAKETGRGENANLEDRLSVAAQVAYGLEVLKAAGLPGLGGTVASTLSALADAVTDMEADILDASDTPVGTSGMTLEALLAALLASFAGRSATRDRVHFFTTNYDRLIEWGAEQAGLRQVDRFVGTLEPKFRTSRLEIDYHYASPGTVRQPRHLDGVFRLTKLHGSLDWRKDMPTGEVRRVPCPFGTRPPNAMDLIIYPNAAKDVETGLFPYADLFRDFAAALCRPNSVLITYGFSFGDSHITRIIADMLTLPSTHLLVISHDDPGGRIDRFVRSQNVRGQISRMIGPKFGDLTPLVEHWLPWIPCVGAMRQREQPGSVQSEVGSLSAPGLSSDEGSA